MSETWYLIQQNEYGVTMVVGTFDNKAQALDASKALVCPGSKHAVIARAMTTVRSVESVVTEEV